MLDQEDDLEPAEDDIETKRISRKKMLIFTLPILIVIGVIVGFYYIFNHNYNQSKNSYNVIENAKSSDGKESVTVFYDLPEIGSDINFTYDDSDDNKKHLRLRLNLELSNIEDVKIIEAITPRLKDIVLTHIVELTPQELEGNEGLYWLKEELLYRINLVASPVKIQNLNIKSIELQKIDNN